MRRGYRSGLRFLGYARNDGATLGMAVGARNNGGRVVETGEGRTPRPEETLTEICYRLSQRIVLTFAALCRRWGNHKGQPMVLGPGYRRNPDSTPNCVAHSAPSG